MAELDRLSKENRNRLSDKDRKTLDSARSAIEMKKRVQEDASKRGKTKVAKNLQSQIDRAIVRFNKNIVKYRKIAVSKPIPKSAKQKDIDEDIAGRARPVPVIKSPAGPSKRRPTGAEREAERKKREAARRRQGMEIFADPSGLESGRGLKPKPKPKVKLKRSRLSAVQREAEERERDKARRRQGMEIFADPSGLESGRGIEPKKKKGKPRVGTPAFAYQERYPYRGGGRRGPTITWGRFPKEDAAERKAEAAKKKADAAKKKADAAKRKADAAKRKADAAKKKEGKPRVGTPAFAYQERVKVPGGGQRGRTITWGRFPQEDGAERKPEVVVKTKPKPRPEPKPRPQPEPRPEPKPEPKPRPQPRPQPEPRPEPKPKPKPKPRPESKPPDPKRKPTRQERFPSRADPEKGIGALKRIQTTKKKVEEDEKPGWMPWNWIRIKGDPHEAGPGLRVYKTPLGEIEVDSRDEDDEFVGMNQKGGQIKKSVKKAKAKSRKTKAKTRKRASLRGSRKELRGG